MTSTADIQPAVSSLVTISSEGTLTLSIAGHLDASTMGSLWRQAMQMLGQERPARLVIDASGISYCDGAGVALLLQLRSAKRRPEGRSKSMISRRRCNIYWISMARRRRRMRLPVRPNRFPLSSRSGEHRAGSGKTCTRSSHFLGNCPWRFSTPRGIPDRCAGRMRP